MRIRVAVAAAVLVVLTGCGGGDEGGSTDGSGSAGGQDQIAKCDDLIGKPGGQLADGCAAPNGDIQGVLTFSCGDGTDWYAAGDEQRMWWARKDGTVAAGTQAEYDAAHRKCITG